MEINVFFFAKPILFSYSKFTARTFQKNFTNFKRETFQPSGAISKVKNNNKQIKVRAKRKPQVLKKNSGFMD